MSKGALQTQIQVDL